jgi:hypothetical protein
MPPCTANISVNTSSSESTSQLVEAQFASQDSITLQKHLAAGLGVNQCNLIYEKRGPAAASPDDIDLSLINDQNGQLAAFAVLKVLIVCNKGAENPLEVSGSYFGTNPAIIIPPGGAFALILAAGVDISAVNDGISIGSALGTDYELRAVGVKVPEPTQE